MNSALLNQTCRVEFIRPTVFHLHLSSRCNPNAGNRQYSGPGPLATGWQRYTTQSGEHPHPSWQHGRKLMISPDNPGKGNNITRFVQVSEFTNQQACCGDIREQRMTTAGNRGDAIDLMVQGMTPPAQ
jgi:hypothetical protein